MACKRWVKDQKGTLKKVRERAHVFSNFYTNGVKSLSRKNRSANVCVSKMSR